MANSKEPRDERLYINAFARTSPPTVTPIPKSYYHSPADQDYFYKAQAIAKPTLATFIGVGAYDAYAHRGYRTIVPLLAHTSLFIFPAITAGTIFIAANAVAVKIKGKDTPWCHFWGAFSSVAYISHHYNLKVTYPIGFILGLVAVRYRYSRVREIELGKPMIPFKHGLFSDRMIPTFFTHLLRMDPIYEMPSETPEM